MARDFKTLIKINDWQVDEKRRMLADQLRQQAALQDRLTALEQEIVQEQEYARTAPTEAGLTYAAYAEVAIDRRENLRKAIILQAQGVEAARERLREAYLELKKYEVAEEHREAEVAAEFAKQEQAELDEVGLVNHIRKIK